MKKFVMMAAIALSGCVGTNVDKTATLDRNLNMKYSSEYGDKFCPTSSGVYGFLIAAAPVAAMGMPIVGVGMGIIAGGTFLINNTEYETFCVIEKESVEPVTD